MEDIVEQLKKLLLSDWNDVNFVIGTNPNDQIEIKFDMQTVDTLQGLHAYMNTMLNTNDDVIRYQLKKLPRYWGYREENFVYYMRTPPWVKLFINDVINQNETNPVRKAKLQTELENFMGPNGSGDNGFPSHGLDVKSRDEFQPLFNKLKQFLYDMSGTD